MKNFLLILSCLYPFYPILQAFTNLNSSVSSSSFIHRFLKKVSNSSKTLKLGNSKQLFRFSKSKSLIQDGKLKKKCQYLYQICEFPQPEYDKKTDFFFCNRDSKEGAGYCLKSRFTSCVNSRACGYELMCVGGYCERALSCKKIGQFCTKNVDCCTNLLCSEVSKKCERCYECREQHETCYIDSHCRGWSLHCKNGYCTQCEDLVFKKSCVKYGYFCRMDEECRPNLRCYYLEFKDEYLCLGAKDFSEEEPENYKVEDENSPPPEESDEEDKSEPEEDDPENSSKSDPNAGDPDKSDPNSGDTSKNNPNPDPDPNQSGGNKENNPDPNPGEQGQTDPNADPNKEKSNPSAGTKFSTKSTRISSKIQAKINPKSRLKSGSLEKPSKDY